MIPKPLARMAACSAVLIQVALPVDALGLSIIPPDGWTQVPMASQGAATNLQWRSTLASDGFHPTLVLQRVQVDSTLKGAQEIRSLLERVESEQKRIFAGFRVMEKRLDTINGLGGGVLLTRYSYGSYDLSTYQFLCLKDGKLLTLAFTSSTKAFPAMRELFEGSLSTLAW